MTRAERAPGISRFSGVALATVFAAVSGYLIVLVAARSLGAARYDVFAVYWAAFFALTGVLSGLMYETTRAVRAGLRSKGGRDDAALPVRFGVLVAAVVASALLLTSPVWADRVVPETTLLGVALLALAAASFAFQAVLGGALSGSGLWKQYAGLLVLDAGLRLVVAGVAVALGHPEVGLLVATVVGSVAWVVLALISSGARASLRHRADVGRRTFARRAIQAMVASSATAMLVVGFPVLLKAAAPHEDPATLGGLLLAVTFTRAPLLVPMTAFQSAIVVHFVEQRARGVAALARPVAVVLAVAMGGAVAAWFVGGRLLALMGAGFDLPSATLAGLTIASGATAALFLSGAACLAHERHAHYVMGWWTATIVAVVMLALPTGLEARAVLALTVGPLAGLTWHSTAVARSRRHPARSALGG